MVTTDLTLWEDIKRIYNTTVWRVWMIAGFIGLFAFLVIFGINVYGLTQGQETAFLAAFGGYIGFNLATYIIAVLLTGHNHITVEKHYGSYTTKDGEEDG